MFKRVTIFVYGLVCYAVFFATFLYAIGFVANYLVPRGIDGVPAMGFGKALAIDLGLLGLFAVQHSVMARPVFKRWITKFIPEAAERSTYVLAASVALILLFHYWQPLGGLVWDVADGTLRAVLLVLCAFGWLLVLLATFLINHFDLFGLRQVWLQLTWPAVLDAEVLDPRAVPAGPPSAVPGFPLRLLGHPDDDRRPSGIRRGDDGLHPHRHPAGGARPGLGPGRGLPQLPGAGPDDSSPREAGSPIS